VTFDKIKKNNAQHIVFLSVLSGRSAKVKVQNALHVNTSR
jgi:hypothetical protein